MSETLRERQGTEAWGTGAVPPLGELVEALAPGKPGRERAAHTLLRHLEGLASRVLASWRLSREEREEAAQDVVAAILAEPEAFRTRGWGYLSRMLQNRQLTLARLGRRQIDAPAAEVLAHVAVAPAPDPVEVAERWKLLDRAHAQSVAARRLQDRGALERSWPQLKALLEGRLGMRELVLREEGLPADVTDAAFKTAQDRLYQQHKRCRGALAQGLHALEAEGLLGPEDARLARQQLERLLRMAPAGGGARGAVSGVRMAADPVER